MGLSIFTATPYKAYEKYLEVENLNLLKEQWPPVKLFKLKKIFESNSTTIEGHNQKILTFDLFLYILPQLSMENYCSYSEPQKRRLYDIFDRQNLGYLTWNNFFLTYTLCEFGSSELLAVIMFSIFDFNLKRKLSHNQLEQMLNKNSKYLKEDGSMEIDEEIVLDALIKNRTSLSLEQWIEQSDDFLDFEKFRKMFNVWAEEELEKQLAQKFNELNNLYNEKKKKYVGYLISYKWFESWKTFVHKEYGIQINGFSNNLTYNRTMRTLRTQKSFRTKKTIKSVKSIRSSKSIHSIKSLKKGSQIPRLRVISFEKKEDDHISQFNLIYSNISDRPTEIYNNLLQGQFSEILIPELVENIHYNIVSEQIWRRLKLIYGAYPEFRRTGQKIIQIYPKNFKIFTKFHKGEINFDEQKFFQFSNNALLIDLISKAIEIQKEELQHFKIFYKTCSLFKWQQISNFNIRTAEISSQQIVFLAVVLLQQAEEFKSINCIVAETTKDLHIGDEFIYIDPVQKTQKKALLMGRTNKKYVIHFKGLSYIYDICIDKEQFMQRSSLSRRAIQSGKHRVKIQQLQLMGLPNSKGFGFVNSVLLSLLSSEQIQRILPSFYRQTPKTLIQYLANIFRMLTSLQVRTSKISDMIRIFFYEYSNFEFTMCQTFLQSFYQSLYQSLKELNYIEIENVFTDYLIKIKRTWSCGNCKKQSDEKISLFCFNLPIPNEELTYYQIIYVPYSYNFKGADMKRYAFSLNKKATLKQYKQTFEKTAQLKSIYYVLAQIHGNNIVKNYLNAKDEATLEDLLLREDDVIYAYELCFHLDSFVLDHYNNESSPKLKGLKVGQMIDFQKEKINTTKFYSKKKVKIQQKKEKFDSKSQNDKIWVFGKITKIDIQSYTHKWSIEVQYRQNRVDIVRDYISPQKTNIAFFPTKSYLFSDQYHLRLLNRVYNEVTNQMQLCNIPFVVMIASWMRMKEVQLLVYQQIRHLISGNSSFKVGDQGYLLEQGQYKVNKKEKMKKFKDYLFNNGKPYKLIFTDLEGRCAICCKIQRSQLSKNQEDFICAGCPIDFQTPIFWKIRPYQTRICADWQSVDSFQRPFISDDLSYSSTKSARKSTVQTLQDCIKQRVQVLRDLQECSCSQSGDGQINYKEQITNVPQRLLFMFDRLIEQQTNYKRINKKYIHFQIDDMILNGQSYQLVAATSIQGSQVDARYLTYLRQKNSWVQYNGQHTRIVKKPVVQKICAILLQYKRVLKNEKKMTMIRE